MSGLICLSAIFDNFGNWEVDTQLLCINLPIAKMTRKIKEMYTKAMYWLSNHAHTYS